MKIRCTNGNCGWKIEMEYVPFEGAIFHVDEELLKRALCPFCGGILVSVKEEGQKRAGAESSA